MTHRHRSLGNLNNVNKEYKRLATIPLPINLSDEWRRSWKEIMKRLEYYLRNVISRDDRRIPKKVKNADRHIAVISFYFFVTM